MHNYLIYDIKEFRKVESVVKQFYILLLFR